MIAIKGMEELPKSCSECPMYQSEDSDYCDITGEWITGEEMVRHKDCPLVEIVTCKDCKHRIGCKCTLLNLLVDDSGFCAKRRKERVMNKNLAILVIGFILTITLAIGIGIGIRISNSKETKATEYHNECPMCHSDVKLMVRQYTCGNDYMIECLNDDCGMHTGYFEDKEELVEKWNKMFKTLSERKGK